MKIPRDPLTAEARSARMEPSVQFGHDLRKLCVFLRHGKATRSLNLCQEITHD